MQQPKLSFGCKQKRYNEQVMIINKTSDVGVKNTCDNDVPFFGLEGDTTWVLHLALHKCAQTNSETRCQNRITDLSNKGPGFPICFCQTAEFVTWRLSKICTRQQLNMQQHSTGAKESNTTIDSCGSTIRFNG